MRKFLLIACFVIDRCFYVSAQENAKPRNDTTSNVFSLSEVTVTARRRSEEAQHIPTPVTVIGAKEIEQSLSFNVNRIKELVPSVQLYASNPKNTTLNVRGIGATFGLTNEGIDQGVGFYVDGVYYSRPAAAALDFIDVEQIEVLRGPQGTLFGKNTTAGAFNITTRKPTFTITANFEQSFGNYGFIQTRGSVSGPLVKNKLAALLAFSGTHRDGTVYNKATGSYTNTLSNKGVRGQLLYSPTENIRITLAGDFNRQRPDGYAIVFSGSAPTQRPGYRQFDSIIALFNYRLPGRNAFDRIIDTDIPWRSNQDMGGASLNADFKIGNGTLTATTAWRKWVWSASNDRDYTALHGQESNLPTIQQSWSQEIRYAGNINKKLGGVAGLFLFTQKMDPDGPNIQKSGADQWAFVRTSKDPRWQTPGLLDGYGQDAQVHYKNFSGALFGQLDWKLSERFTVLPGIRLNYDEKSVDYRRTVFGGLQTEDSTLKAYKKAVYSPQDYAASGNNTNVSGQLTIQFKAYDKIRLFGTYALSFKPIGLNIDGLPTDKGRVMTEYAVIKPERVNHFELGMKSEPAKNAILNLSIFNTDIYNYQTNVQSSELGVNRGYLANAKQVRTRGVELEAVYAPPQYFRISTAISYTDARFVKFTNAPVPLEETGGKNAYTDISGKALPGVSKWIISAGPEGFINGKFIGQQGQYFAGADIYHRSSFSSAPTPSRYLNIDGYSLINARMGFRTTKGITIFVWGRNLGNTNYFEQLLPAPGNAGAIGGVLGDPETYGVTVRYNFN